MGKLLTSEFTITWHCEFCGFEEIRSAADREKLREIEVIPMGWSWVILVPSTQDVDIGTTYELNYSKEERHYVASKKELKSATSCPTCSKNLPATLRREDPDKPEKSTCRSSTYRRGWLLLALLSFGFGFIFSSLLMMWIK